MGQLTASLTSGNITGFACLALRSAWRSERSIRSIFPLKRVLRTTNRRNSDNRTNKSSLLGQPTGLPVKNPADDRSSLALAYGWAVRVTTISLEMVVPGLIGLWIDRQLGTVMVFLVLGMILGVTGGMLHLVRLTAALQRSERSDRKSSDDHANE